MIGAFAAMLDPCSTLLERCPAVLALLRAQGSIGIRCRPTHALAAIVDPGAVSGRMAGEAE